MFEEITESNSRHKKEPEVRARNLKSRADNILKTQEKKKKGGSGELLEKLRVMGDAGPLVNFLFE